MKKRICIICSAILLTGVVCGCATRDGKVAASVAKELMESGSYTAAAEQCAIAIGNGVKDKEFEHMADVINSYNTALNLLEDGKVDRAKEELYKIVDYSDFKIAYDIDDLKDRIRNIESGTGDVQTIPKENNTDYSKYDSSLKSAYVWGAETGSVYFWNDSTGNGYSTTLINGTQLYTTQNKANGRTLVKWNGKYGWLTSKYLNVGDVNSTDLNYYIGGASTGSVYVWKYSTGNEYYSTIPNGTVIYPTGGMRNDRIEIYWEGGYAWITYEYVR